MFERLHESEERKGIEHIPTHIWAFNTLAGQQKKKKDNRRSHSMPPLSYHAWESSLRTFTRCNQTDLAGTERANMPPIDDMSLDLEEYCSRRPRRLRTLFALCSHETRLARCNQSITDQKKMWNKLVASLTGAQNAWRFTVVQFRCRFKAVQSRCLCPATSVARAVLYKNIVSSTI